MSRRAYYNQPTWKRVVVILAGPAMNILIAFVLFAGVLLAGNLNGAIVLSNLGGTQTHREHRQGGQRETRCAGLRRAAQGRSHRDASTAPAPRPERRGPWRPRRTAVAGAQTQGCRAATPVHLVVERGGRTVPLTIYPRYDAKANAR